MLRTLRSLSPALAVALLAAPAAAHAAPVAKASAAKSKTVYPTVSAISPRKITVGQKLTIRGKNFRAGKGKSSVAFYKSGKAVIFVKADTATSRTIVVTIPVKVAALLVKKDDAFEPTLLRLRVIGAKMSRSWTQNSRSPIVAGLPPATKPAPATPVAPLEQQQAAVQKYLTCQQTAAANPSGDEDGDGVTNSVEIATKLDPCNDDTDGDTVTDGYEYYSAIDLNGRALPYPGKRPWPNPLDPSDTDYDFDGDGLQLWQEFELWKASKSGFPLTQYSDGNQNTGGTQPVTTTAQSYLDLDRDGNLTDDERDFDGDGLSNMIEYNYRGTQAWWKGIGWYDQPHGDGTNHSYVEPWYSIRAFSDLDATDIDSDGDGIPDGADDQDNDGWSNFAEMQLSRAQIGYRVHPFNPCLPDPHARVCSRWLPMDGAKWAPFDQVRTDPVTQAPIYSAMDGDAIPFGWPQITYASWGGGATGTVLGPWDPSPWFTAAWDGTTGPQGA